MAPASFIMYEQSPSKREEATHIDNNYMKSQNNTPITPKATADAQLRDTVVHICRNRKDIRICWTNKVHNQSSSSSVSSSPARTPWCRSKPFLRAHDRPSVYGSTRRGRRRVYVGLDKRVNNGYERKG